MENWQNELLHLITSIDELEKYIKIKKEDKESAIVGNTLFPLQITPYYANLLSSLDENHPLRKTILPTSIEESSVENLPNFDKEEEFSPVKGIRVELQGRATIIVTHFCPNHCRYCFRKYWVMTGGSTLSFSDADNILNYIRNNTNITECCLSGGEPLIATDDLLEYIISGLAKIEHVKIIRIFTRIIAVLPSRITDKLVNILKMHPTIYIIAHFDHKDELTNEAIKASRALSDNGIPVFSATVLLRGINDTDEILGELFEKCLQNKIKPFYLYHCVPAIGTKHLVTDINVGTKIIERLYAKLSALCIPLYSVPLIGEKLLAMPSIHKDKLKAEDGSLLLKDFLTDLNLPKE